MFTLKLKFFHFIDVSLLKQYNSFNIGITESELVVLKKSVALFLCIVLAFSLSGCFLLPKEASAPELPLVTPYSGEEYLTAQVSRGDFSLIREVSFSFQPTRREKLSFNMVGKEYGTVFVSAGDTVTAGQLVASLDVTDVEQRIASVDAEIARLTIKLEEAETAYDLAVETEKLTGSPSTVSSDARAADAAFYKASLELQKGKKDELLAERESLRLYATIDGTVTYAKALYPGAVSNKTDTVVTITDAASSVFSAVTDQHKLFPLGSEFTVISDGIEYTCIVRDAAELGIENSESNKAQGREVVCLEVIGAETPSGSSAKGTVTIEIDSRHDVLMLPKRAVFMVEDSYYVYLEDENGLKNAREIQCGLESDKWIEVISGLSEGDNVILR